MASGLLSLKWNNHRSTFFHVLSSIRSKESYCDATLACDGRFYPVHKLVLSTCSEYFEQIFERTQCKHPVIVLKDIKYEDLEALMNYMYVGEVNVLQEKLSGLIKAAECLKIKGLAVPDEDPSSTKEIRRNSHRSEVESPRAKRKRRDDSFPYEDKVRNRESKREAQLQENHESENLVSTGTSEALENSSKTSDVESDAHDDNNDQSSTKEQKSSEDTTKRISSHKLLPEISQDDTNVKTEPPDIIVPELDLDVKENLHSDLQFNPNDGDSRGAGDNDSIHGGNSSEYSDVMDSGPQSVEDVVAQALPSSSSFQGNAFSLWEGESSYPGESYSGENSQGRQMPIVDEYEFVKSKRGKDQLSFKGYIYQHQRSRNFNHYFRCEDRYCHGSATLRGVTIFNAFGGSISEGKPHNHSSKNFKAYVEGENYGFQEEF